MIRQRRTIADDIQNQVRERAQHLCEYCHTSELWQYVRFTVDHILPLSKGGTDDLKTCALPVFIVIVEKVMQYPGLIRKRGKEPHCFIPVMTDGMSILSGHQISSLFLV